MMTELPHAFYSYLHWCAALIGAVNDMNAIHQILRYAAGVVADNAECYVRIFKCLARFDQKGPRQHHVAKGCMPDNSDTFDLIAGQGLYPLPGLSGCPDTFCEPKFHNDCTAIEAFTRIDERVYKRQVVINT